MSELQTFFLTLPVYYMKIKLHHKNYHAGKSGMGNLENAYNMMASASSSSQSFQLHLCLLSPGVLVSSLSHPLPFISRSILNC